MTTLSAAAERYMQQQAWLDPIADELHDLISKGLDALPNGEGVEDALHGEWLGHPLHPSLVEIPLGAWGTAATLDVLGALGLVKNMDRASDAALLIGTLGSFAAIATGWAEWHRGPGRLPRRIGVAHGLLNEAAVVLNCASLLARWRGKRGLGRALSLSALAASGTAAFLGGELVYRHGVGVRR